MDSGSVRWYKERMVVGVIFSRSLDREAAVGELKILCFFRSECLAVVLLFFFFSSRRRHTRFDCDWSSDVCSSDLADEATNGVQIRVLIADDQALFARMLEALLADDEEVEVVGYAKNGAEAVELARSEERRVGKECRSRWSPDH